MAAPTCVITVLHDFAYRGEREEWSTQYFLTGATPADASEWRTLFDALAAEEKTVLNGAGGDVRIIGGYGYDHIPDATHHAVWSVDLRIAPDTPIPGTVSITGAIGTAPGDDAVWIRWGLDRVNSKGKRIYLRKYFHGALIKSGTTDETTTAWQTAASAFAEKLTDGSFLDGRRITDRLGTALLGHKVSTYITTRTLKRRGKRPPA